MRIFLFILTNNIVPIFTLILFGYFMSKKFNLDLYTLAKLNFYIFVPSFCFVSLYSAKISFEMVKVVAVMCSLLVVNMGIGFIVSKIRGYDEGLKNSFVNSIMFFNSGNTGIPLITLIFSSVPFVIDGQTPYLTLALTVQVIIDAIQNIATNTLGFINAGRGNTHWKESLLKVFTLPTIYVIPLALILKLIPYDFTSIPLWPALNYGRNALVAVALITLGVQLSRTKFEFTNKEVYLSSAVKLVCGPVIGMILIYLFDVDGIIAQVMMISSALPTGVLTALIAVEYDNYPDFASQAVMTSTLLATISLVGVIYMARMIFPVV